MYLGETPLLVSAENNNTEETRRLLLMGFNVNMMDKYKQTPLHLAAAYSKDDSHFFTIETLLRRGAKVNAQDSIGRTPMHYLVFSTNLQTVQLFLKFGADVDIQEKDGRTPLVTAVRTGSSVEVVKLLLDNSLDINCGLGQHKYTLLHYACWRERIIMVKLLVKYGASLDVKDFDERTPLMIALSYFPNERIVRFLLKHCNIGKGHLLFQLDDTGKMIMQILTKYQALGMQISQSILETITNRDKLNEYFEKCKEELKLAMSTKIDNCWITYFDFLVDCKKKLKNYAGNEDLVQSFNRTDLENKFPIYGPEILKNLEKGIKRRDKFDKSCVMLSSFVPVFNPTHLVIKDVLDCLTFSDYVLLAPSTV